MERETAIEIAGAFIAGQPKDWQVHWPTRRQPVARRTRSRKSEEEIWLVHPETAGLGQSMAWVEVWPSTGQVGYAWKFGGREWIQEYFEGVTSIQQPGESVVIARRPGPG